MSFLNLKQTPPNFFFVNVKKKVS